MEDSMGMPEFVLAQPRDYAAGALGVFRCT